MAFFRSDKDGWEIDAWDGNPAKLQMFKRALKDVFVAKKLAAEPQDEREKASIDSQKCVWFRKFCTKDVRDRLMQMPEEDSMDWDKLMQFVDENFGKQPEDQIEACLKEMLALQQGDDRLRAYITKADDVFRRIAELDRDLDFRKIGKGRLAGLLVRNGLRSGQLKQLLVATAGTEWDKMKPHLLRFAATEQENDGDRIDEQINITDRGAAPQSAGAGAGGGAGQQDWRRQQQCRYCKDYGHIKYFCPKKKAADERRDLENPYKDQRDKDPKNGKGGNRRTQTDGKGNDKSGKSRKTATFNKKQTYLQGDDTSDSDDSDSDDVLGCVTGMANGARAKLLAQQVVLFDTGSTHKVCSRAWINRHNVELKNVRELTKPKRTRTAGGPVPVQYKADIVCYLPTKGGDNVQWKFTEVDILETDQMVPLLIGMDMIERFDDDVAMDFKTNVMTVRPLNVTVQWQKASNRLRCCDFTQVNNEGANSKRKHANNAAVAAPADGGARAGRQADSDGRTADKNDSGKAPLNGRLLGRSQNCNHPDPRC